MNGDAQLPLYRERFFRRERRSIRAARVFVAMALWDWWITEREYEVVLCASELATNAVLHGVPPGRGYRIQLWLGLDGVLRIEVHDSGDGEPRIPDPDDEAECGRGLLLVAELADKWGVEARDPGKIVWCEFALTERCM